MKSVLWSLVLVLTCVACGSETESKSGGAGGQAGEAGAGGQAGEAGSGGQAGEAGAGGQAGEAGAGGTAGQTSNVGLPIENLIAEVAQATCQSVSNCCNASELELYFAPLRYNEYLTDIQSQFPPDTPFDMALCVDLLTTAYQRVPFGPWVEAVNSGYATYDGEAAADCVSQMRAAECGQAFAEVMFGGECFGFPPPSSDSARRRAFTQPGTVGDACVGLNDGVGGAFFGTCDPLSAICTFDDPDTGNPRIASVERGEVGVCVPSSGENERCDLATMKICRKGLGCVDGVCTPPITTTLNVGDVCYENWQLQGDCQNSYCDIFGAESVCRPFKALGDDCAGAGECGEGHCVDGVCVAGAYCDGE